MPFASALFYVRPMMYKHMYSEEGTDGKAPNMGVLSFEKLSTSALCGVLTSTLVTPLSQAPSVIAANQQGHATSFTQAVQDIRSRYGWRGFFRGLGARTLSLAGTFTVVPLALEGLQSALHSGLNDSE